MAGTAQRPPIACAALVLALGATACVTAEPPPVPGAAEDVRRVVATLDDLVADYPAAVADPAAADQTRLAVLDRLLHLATVDARRFPAAERAAIDQVVAAVTARHPAAGVVDSAGALRAQLLDRHQLVLGPATPPPRARSVTLWRMACWGCHGSSGAGDGPQGLYLVPEPKDFHEPDFMASLSPARAFSRITDGMAGTAMPSWGSFTTAERWGLASYLFSFRHDPDAVARGRAAQARIRGGASFLALAERTDGELLAELTAAGLDDDDASDALAFLRVEAAFTTPDGPLASVRDRLAAALNAHEERRWADADAGFAATRRQLAPALDLLRGVDPTAAARLEHRFARLDAERATRDLHDALAHEVRHLDRWLDRADARLRAPSLTGAIRLGLSWAAAAAIGLGMLLASAPPATRRAVGAGLAASAGLGAALVPASLPLAVAGLALIGGLAIALAARRAEASATALLVGLPIGAIARLEVGWFGGGGALVWLAAVAILLAVGLLSLRVATRWPRLRGLLVPALAIAAAATAGRAAWLLATASGRTPADRLGWRIEALGLYPAPPALVAAAVSGLVVAALMARRVLDRPTCSSPST